MFVWFIWLYMLSFLFVLFLEQIEVAALGRPLFPGMLYDCRKDSFILGDAPATKTSSLHFSKHVQSLYASQ